MTKSGLFRHSKQISEGKIGLGTKFRDTIRHGYAVGEITKYKEPTTIEFQQIVHIMGFRIMESRPGYTLEAHKNDTIVHHYAEGNLFGLFKIMKPIITMIAEAERKRTVNALKRSFETSE
jgi:hypothetical protein